MKEKYGKMVESDIRFSGSSLIKMSILSFLGGLISTTVGIGGGMIFNPILLNLGMPAKVSSATGMYMIMYAKLASSITFLVFGLLDIQFGLWIGFWCAIGAMMGLMGVNLMLKKFKRQSYIVFILFLVIAICTVFIPTFGAKDLADKVSARGHEALWETGSLC